MDFLRGINLPNNCFASQQVLYESVLVWVERTTFRLKNGHDGHKVAQKFCNFLDGFGGTSGYDKVRNLQTGSPDDAYILPKFPGLQYLAFSYAWLRVQSPFLDVVKDKKKLMKMYGLAPVAECGVETLCRVDLIDGSGNVRDPERWTPLSDTVQVFLKEVLKGHKKAISIKSFFRRGG